jgi:hypothetical protein
MYPDIPQETTVSEQDSSAMMLLPQAYQPVHQRDTSGSRTGIYSDKRNSTIKAKHERTTSTGSRYNFSFPENSARNCKESPYNPVSMSSLAPPSSKDRANDPRFSEFYEAYFRNSQLSPGLKFDTSVESPTQPTITGIPSPLPSPKLPGSGMAV